MLLTAAIIALGCWLLVIPTSLLTNLSGVGAAGHIGTGGGLTQEDLAGAIKLDRPYITLIESGAKQPSLSVVWRLAAGLQITMSELATLVDVQLARLQSPPTAPGAAKKVAARRKP